MISYSRPAQALRSNLNLAAVEANATENFTGLNFLQRRSVATSERRDSDEEVTARNRSAVDARDFTDVACLGAGSTRRIDTFEASRPGALRDDERSQRDSEHPPSLSALAVRGYCATEQVAP